VETRVRGEQPLVQFAAISAPSGEIGPDGPQICRGQQFVSRRVRQWVIRCSAGPVSSTAVQYAMA
jgi:hypothetical protein